MAGAGQPQQVRGHDRIRYANQPIVPPDQRAGPRRHLDFASAVTRRTTVLVLGDARNNGNDPNLGAFEEIARRARETIWLTPEPRYSWCLGSCTCPPMRSFATGYVVVRALNGLERAAHGLRARWRENK